MCKIIRMDPANRYSHPQNGLYGCFSFWQIPKATAFLDADVYHNVYCLGRAYRREKDRKMCKSPCFAFSKNPPLSFCTKKSTPTC